MPYDINRLHGATEALPVQGRIPASLSPEVLMKVLRNLDLAVPKALTIAASRGDPLHTSKHVYSIAEVDAALNRHNVPTSERIHFKATLSRFGVMER